MVNNAVNAFTGGEAVPETHSREGAEAPAML